MPANQSLILAGEPLSGTTATLVNSAALRRVTVYEAHSSTVVVQADYYPQNEPVYVTPRERSTQGSAYLKPVELYARTQRGQDERPRAAILDVLA